MLLFIERYPYLLDYHVKGDLTIKDILEGIVSFPELEKTQSFAYVGYCYSKKAKDVVFFLPKVVLTGETEGDDQADTIFGASPLEVIDFENERIKGRKKGARSTRHFCPTFPFGFIAPSACIEKPTTTIFLKAGSTKKKAVAESKGTTHCSMLL